MPPGGQANEKRRGEFKEYVLNDLTEWIIDKSLKDRIIAAICPQEGDRLEEFIGTFKSLLVYTDKKYKKQHQPDTRETKPGGIKKGMYTFLILEPLKKPGNYLYTMRLYFTYGKILYDFEIGSDDF